MFCKKCGNQIPDNAKFCGVCGTKVGQENDETAICKKCGNKFEKRFGVCPVCGTSAENNDAPVPIQKADNVWGQDPSYNNSQAATVKRHALKWWHILIISVSSVLVLCIIALSVTAIKPNSNGGMLQPGAASIDELIDTLSDNSIISEEAISMMSNYTLWYFAVECEQPSVMYDDTSEIRSAIIHDEVDDDAADLFAAIEKARIFIQEVEETDGWDYSDLTAGEIEELNEELDATMDELDELEGVDKGTLRMMKKSLLAEIKATEKSFDVYGYFKHDGEREEIDDEIMIIKANGRYYWAPSNWTF